MGTVATAVPVPVAPTTIGTPAVPVCSVPAADPIRGKV